MELLELVNGFKKIMNTESIEQAQHKLMTVLFDRADKEKVFNQWLEFCPDLEKDYMQMIFQYYFADRENLGQDYTPVCLGALLSELCDCKDNDTVTDMCCGSGSLTIQQWNRNKNLKFECKEFDERAIPFLLFNLSIRNIKATVYRCDVLSGEVSAVYRLTHGKKYSVIEEVTGDVGNLYQ